MSENDEGKQTAKGKVQVGDLPRPRQRALYPAHQMARVILAERLYNREFVRRWVNWQQYLHPRILSLDLREQRSWPARGSRKGTGDSTRIHAEVRRI